MSVTMLSAIDRAANECGKLRLGQSLQTQDQTRFQAGYDEVYDDLETEGLATWSSTGAMPNNVAPWVIWLVAHNCAGTYGVSLARFNRIVGHTGLNGERAKRELRKILQPPHSSEEPVMDY